MNYEANEIEWKVGDIVIHDCDAKKEHMLMVVFRIETDEFGTCYHTRYKYGGNFPDATKVWKNCKDVLHDPKRFNLECKN